MPPAHVELTAVVYEEGDMLGLLLAYASLAPQALVIAQASALLAAESPDRRVALARLLAGQLLNQGLSVALKHVFRAGRPTTSARMDYGMPSSHAQFVAYLFVMACYLLASAAQSPGRGWRGAMSRLLARILVAASLFIAAMVCVSRVYLEYHNCAQVLAGCLFGLGFGLLWIALPFGRFWRCAQLDLLSSFLDTPDHKRD